MNKAEHEICTSCGRTKEKKTKSIAPFIILAVALIVLASIIIKIQ